MEIVKNPRMGALKFLSFVEMDIMYVDTRLNQRLAKSNMVDSSVTQNSITDVEARTLKLCWEKSIVK